MHTQRTQNHRIGTKVLAVFLTVLMLLTCVPLAGSEINALFPKAKAASYNVGDIITFGGYPQSEVTDSATISALDALDKTWVSYGYYSGTGDWEDGQMQPGDWMRYADIFYNGAKYRAVTFDSYRPNYTGRTSSAENSYQDDNGYYSGNIYYFKFESLKWRVLDPYQGLVLCESIIDSQAYQNTIYWDPSSPSWEPSPYYYQGIDSTVFANNYAASSIRRWLINDFYNTAFSFAEQSEIYQTNPTYIDYSSNYPYDTIYLLPDIYIGNNVPDECIYNNGLSNDIDCRADGTDYAKCQGVDISDSYTTADGKAASPWWLLNFNPYDPSIPRNESATVVGRGASLVCNTSNGVRPVFRFYREIVEDNNPNGSDTHCGVGDIITFGAYPQSEVTDSAKISALNAIEKTWVSYNYYSGTGNIEDGQMTPGNWMRYADIFYNGAKYRAVTFDSYRPSFTGRNSSANHSYQDDSGYYSGNVYYFKFESLKWRVLDPNAGLVLSEIIIDAQAYQNTIYYDNYSTKEYYQNRSRFVYANDYTASSIRSWLINDFYNTAFSSTEKTEIAETNLDNSAYYTSDSMYDSTSTSDKIFLLSNNIKYVPRRAPVTDYTKCQSVFLFDGSQTTADGTAISEWYLRSPGTRSNDATGIDMHGQVSFLHVGEIAGVRPAFCFKSGIVEGAKHNYVAGEPVAPTCIAQGYTVYTCSRCGDTVNKDFFAAMGHTPELIPEIPATCTQKGRTAGSRCSGCGVVFSTGESTDKLPHTDNNGDKFCDNCGYDMQNRCGYCGEVHSGHLGGLIGLIHQFLLFFKNIFHR